MIKTVRYLCAILVEMDWAERIVTAWFLTLATLATLGYCGVIR